MQRGISRFSLAALSVSLGLTAAFAAGASRAGANAPKGAPKDRVVALRDIKGLDTVLAFDPTAVAQLKAGGVSISAEGTAKSADADITLPISSGYVETHSDQSFHPKDLLGSVETFGAGITLTAGGTSVQLSDLVFDLSDSMVYVNVGETENVPFFSVKRGQSPVERSGATLKIGEVQLALTPTGAAELTAIFQTSLLAPSTVVATASITVTGSVYRYAYNEVTNEYPRLAGIDTSVSFEPAPASELAKVGVTPGASGSATYDPKTGLMNFPITGGILVVHPNKKGDPKSVDGVVLAQGSGITFTKGSTSMTMDEPTWVPAAGVVYASVNGGLDNGAVFRIKTAHASLSFDGGNLVLSKAQIALTAGGADALNSVFHTSDFSAGMAIGTFSMTASGG